MSNTDPSTPEASAPAAQVPMVYPTTPSPQSSPSISRNPDTQTQEDPYSWSQEQALTYWLANVMRLDSDRKSKPIRDILKKYHA